MASMVNNPAGEDVASHVIGGIRTESEASPGFFDDPDALVIALLWDVEAIARKEGIDPVGALAVDMTSDVLTGERAYYWRLEV